MIINSYRQELFGSSWFLCKVSPQNANIWALDLVLYSGCDHDCVTNDSDGAADNLNVASDDNDPYDISVAFGFYQPE